MKHYSMLPVAWSVAVHSPDGIEEDHFVHDLGAARKMAEFLRREWRRITPHRKPGEWFVEIMPVYRRYNQYDRRVDLEIGFTRRGETFITEI